MVRVSTNTVRMAHPATRCRVHSVRHAMVLKTHPTDWCVIARLGRVHSVRRSSVCIAHPAVHAAGFSYVEVLIATLLIVVTLLPAIEALYPAVAGAGYHGTRVEDHYQLAGRLEELLVEPFADLDAAATAAGNETTPTTYSDTVTHADGRQITRNVFLSRYDSDNADADNNPFTDTEDDLLWIRVEIAGTTDGLETLYSVYD